MKRLPLVLALIAALGALTACTPTTSAAPTRDPSPATTPAGSPAPPAPLTAAELAGLPAAVYDAVIPGLLPAPANPRFTTALSVETDTALYGADLRTPVARIPRLNFLDEPTVVVPIGTRGGWTQVLTPSRRALPSQAPAGTDAPAQTSAWLPTSALEPFGDLPNRVTVSVSAQTLTITDTADQTLATFPVGVGTAETPTPTGVTGYIQARYLDPAQDQTVHRIQLTTLHATASDEPFGGSDGGLIGIHYQETATGAVSHGCIRLSADGIAAVDALPLGTPVRIVA